MKKSSPRMHRVVVILSLLLGWALLASASVAETYKVDQAHSFVMFRAKRMGVVYVYGRFNDFSGTLTMSGDDISSGSLALEVRTESVDSGNERRDTHLRSPDFFNAKQLPVMSFSTTSLKGKGGNVYEVRGDLTLLGVTKEVIAEVEHVGTGKDRRSGKTMVGFDTTFVIQRSDFGMKFMSGPLSEDIDIHLAIQAIEQ